ncbi:MAG: glycosyltransferase [Pseudomonadota bacterium]
MKSVSIAIPTLARPSLKDVLRSLAAQKYPHSLDVELLIADDGPTLSARELVAEVSLPFPVKMLEVCAQNIAVARNACLSAAKGDFLLFIDDDEIAGETWIADMAQQMEETGADCLFAPVQPVYQPSAPDWVTKLNPLFPGEIRTSLKAETVVGRTGNSAIRMAFVHKNNLEFDTRYRLQGEDLFFFNQCAKAGADMRAVSHPAVMENVRPQQHQFKNIVKSLFRRGYVYADVQFRCDHQRLRVKTYLIGTSLVKIAVAGLALPVSPLAGPTMVAKQIFSLALDFGKMKRVIFG